MVLLLTSLIVLALGPLLQRMSQRFEWTLSAMDGFVLVGIGGFVLLHLLPEVVATGGWGTLLVGGLGFLAPLVVERWLRGAARRAHLVTLGLALLGVFFHAALDGVVLHETEHGETALAIAVVLHRLPIAVTVWAILRVPYGARVAWATLGLVATGTLVGFFAGHGLLASVHGHEGGGMAWFEALVGGSLLHVVIHRPGLHDHGGDAEGHGDPAHVGGRWKLASGIGGLFGLALFFYQAPAGDHGFAHAEAHVGGAFWGLALESAPALVLAYLAAGLVHVWLPQIGLRWLRSGSNWVGALRGVAFGLPLPMCSCGVIPVYRSLVMRGVPATAAMAFFVATPELGLDAVFLSLPLLGTSITVARVLAALGVAILVGWVVGRVAGPPRQAELTGQEPCGSTSLGKRLLLAIRTGYGEMFDATLPWVLVGLALAALLDPILATPGSWLHDIPPGAEVAFFALLGMPAYVCASGATPLVAVLLAHGVSPGAGIAFLLTGPATNITTFGVLRELHGGKTALAFAGTMAAAAIAVGHLTNLVLGGGAVVPIPRIELSGASWLSQASLALLAGLTLLSLLRQGPRAFISHIISADNSADGDACADGGSCCGGGCDTTPAVPHEHSHQNHCNHDPAHESAPGRGLSDPSGRRA